MQSSLFDQLLAEYLQTPAERDVVKSYLAFSGVYLLCGIVVPILVEWTLRVAVGSPNEGEKPRRLPRYLLGVVVAFFAMQFFETKARELQYVIIPRMDVFVRRELSRLVFRHFEFADRDASVPPSAILHRMNSLSGDICYALISQFDLYLNSARLCAASVFLLGGGARYIAWVAALAAGTALVFGTSSRCSDVVEQGEQKLQRNMVLVDDLLQNAQTIYMHQKEEDEDAELGSDLDELLRVGLQWRRCEVGVAWSANLWAVGMLAVLLVMTYRDFRAQVSDTSHMSTVLAYCMYMLSKINILAEHATRSRRLIAKIRTHEAFFLRFLPGARAGAGTGAGAHSAGPPLARGQVSCPAYDGLALADWTIAVPPDKRTRPDQDFIVHQCAWRVPRGARVALIGANGVGKSQIARALLGWCPSTGSLWWRGSAVALGDRESMRQWRRRISYMGQQYPLLDRSIHENRYYGVGRHIVPAEPGEAGSNHAAGLSGGQRQALIMARIVDQGRDLVMLDEPHSALGPTELDRFLAAFARLPRESTVITITHSRHVADQMDLVYMVADRTISGPLRPEQVAAFFQPNSTE